METSLLTPREFLEKISEINHTYERLYVTGNVVEHTLYEKPVVSETPRSCRVVDLTDEELKERAEKSIKESVRRALRKVKDVINLNFSGQGAFVTLTFADTPSLDQAWNRFSTFIKRLRKRFFAVRYLAVMELHKTGVPHFHCMFLDLPGEMFTKKYYVFSSRKRKDGLLFTLGSNHKVTAGFQHTHWFGSQREAQAYIPPGAPLKVASSSPLAGLWWWGFVDVKQVKGSDTGAYLIKYMSKAVLPPGVTRYSFSRKTLRQQGTTFKNRSARTILEGLLRLIEYENLDDYTGFNEYTGNYTKTFIVFPRESLPDINKICLALRFRGLDDVVQS